MLFVPVGPTVLRVQSRSLYGRHVSSRFLDLFWGSRCSRFVARRSSLWLLNVMLAFVFGLLHFLPILSMWIDSLVACIWGAAGCLFATDVDDGVPASGLVGWWVGHLSVAGRNLVSFPPE